MVALRTPPLFVSLVAVEVGFRSRGYARFFNVHFRRRVPHHHEARTAVRACWQRFPRSTPRLCVGASRTDRFSPALCLLPAPPAPPEHPQIFT